MTRIRRDDFVDTFNSDQRIDVKGLGAATLDAFAKAGLEKSDLDRIAGEDGVIRSAGELRKLFQGIDEADRDGSIRSIETTRRDEDGQTVATDSGKLYEALR